MAFVQYLLGKEVKSRAFQGLKAVIATVTRSLSEKGISSSSATSFHPRFVLINFSQAHIGERGRDFEKEDEKTMT